MPVTSQALHPYARNFHSYRSEEEELLRHGLPLPYGIDHAAFAAAAYHPALLQQQAAFSQGSLRLVLHFFYQILNLDLNYGLKEKKNS